MINLALLHVYHCTERRGHKRVLNENEVKSWTKWFIKLITNEVKYLIYTALIKQLKLCFANEVRSERSERVNVVSAIWLTNVVIVITSERD